MRPRWLNESTHAEKQPHVHPRERLADQPLSRIFHTFERRVRARSLQQSRALVGRVPSRGALLAFPSECETAQPWPAMTGALPLPNPANQPTRPPPPATHAGIPRLSNSSPASLAPQTPARGFPETAADYRHSGKPPPAGSPDPSRVRWRRNTPLASCAACTQVYKPSPQRQRPTTSEPTSGLNGSPRWAQLTEIRFKERKRRLESGPHCVRRVAAKRFGKINRTAMLFSGGQVP
jgi:hypothetical protein